MSLKIDCLNRNMPYTRSFFEGVNFANESKPFAVLCFTECQIVIFTQGFRGSNPTDRLRICQIHEILIPKKSWTYIVLEVLPLKIDD